MLRSGIRYLILAAGLAGVGAPIAARLHAQVTKCYFKDCIVFENGTRICEVKEVPCPTVT